MLIVDGYASHVTTKAIKFCLDHKIVLLCLLLYTTHILQLLDVGIFALLAALYKKRVCKRSRFLIDYSIDKVDFLEIYKIA
jgi:DDE superfamily endonuclease